MEDAVVILIRLQGNTWQSLRRYLKLVAYGESYKGNICGFYTDGTREYIHWMSDAEQKNFKIVKDVYPKRLNKKEEYIEVIEELKTQF